MIHQFSTLAAALFAGLAALSLPAAAEETTGHEGHAMMGDQGPASMAYMEANDRMHATMAIEYSGNPDVDFIRGMIYTTRARSTWRGSCWNTARTPR